jgi:hypothetical protein
MREAMRARRPDWVRVIALFYIATMAWVAMSWYLLQVHGRPAPPEELERLTGLEISLTALSGLANLAGAVALFFLRRQALYWFVAGLALSLTATGWRLLSAGVTPAPVAAGVAGLVIGYAIAVVVCAYTWKLTRSGVLR